MQHLLGSVLALVIGLASASADEGSRREGTTPADAYRELLREYDLDASAAFRAAKSDEERNAAIERMGRFPARFLDLAEAHPGDPIALEALTQAIRSLNSVDSLTQTSWDMNRSVLPARRKDGSAARAVALLSRDHLSSASLGPVCQRLTYGIHEEFEDFLRAVLERNPHRTVQGVACLARANLLGTLLQRLELLEERPELAGRWEDLLGKGFFAELSQRRRAGLAGEVESLFEQAAARYGDVAHPYGGAIGDEARAKLHEIRRLAVGKTAPEIEGTDQDGKRFRLSEYRGKVVLLDFWQEY